MLFGFSKVRIYSIQIKKSDVRNGTTPIPFRRIFCLILNLRLSKVGISHANNGKIKLFKSMKIAISKDEFAFSMRCA